MPELLCAKPATRRPGVDAAARSAGGSPVEVGVRRFRRWIFLLALAGLPAFGADRGDLAAGTGALPTEYVLIVTGGELLDGSISDAHTPFIARSLKPLGLRCVRTILVDDTAEDLQSALGDARDCSALVLTTGGLGPTVNDLTREALSAFTGVPVREEPTVLAELARGFGEPVDSLRENLRRQALVPVSGGYLPNNRGTAVGLIYETNAMTLIALPGPPRELQPMVTEQLVPWLRSRLGLPERGTSILLRFVGIGQSAIDAALRQQITVPPGTVTASSFDGSRVDFTFSLLQDTPSARAQLTALSASVTQHLGRYVYATTRVSLEQVVWNRLATRGTSLVLAEAQGPHLASAFARAQLPTSAQITSIASSSERELGRVLGLRDAAWDGLSGPAARVEALGAAARCLTDAAWTLAVGESVNTGDPRSQVWVTLGYPDGTWDTWRLAVRGSPETGSPDLVDALLDRLRRLDP